MAHGASVHGLPALRQFPGNKWLDVAMIRMNHAGSHMDTENANGGGTGNVDEVVTHMKKVHGRGVGKVGDDSWGDRRQSSVWVRQGR